VIIVALRMIALGIMAMMLMQKRILGVPKRMGLSKEVMDSP
jgi:hypothetical protein